MDTKRVAVIGAGPCGLSAIKSLKEEDIEPICFERMPVHGGLWRYHDDDLDGLASVMKTTIINTSKEMGAFSDFPPDDDVPNYMHNTEVYEYLTKYATQFDLLKHVRFNKEVVKVELSSDYTETGRLDVTVKDTQTGNTTTNVFDGVFVCIGHHVFPNIPSFPGQDNFRGTTMHTHSLKDVDRFTNQVVVVVGVGNSGMDAAVEISAVAKQVYLSTRRGTWVLPRVGPSGVPFDLAVTTRLSSYLQMIAPYWLKAWLAERLANRIFDHEMYNLKPKHSVFSQHPTVSDSLPIKLLSGRVKVRKNIQEFTEDGIIFEGIDHVTNVDSIVFATGYRIKFPFLSEDLSTTKGNRVHLYKYIYPPHLPHPTLAMLGLFQSIGAGFPIGEAQARWASLMIKKNLFLPPREDMEADIAHYDERNAKRFVPTDRHTIQVDYVPYFDEISEQFGAKPNLLKYLITDPILFLALLFGPSLPYQYRLQGPHPWPHARDTILSYKERIQKPLKS